MFVRTFAAKAAVFGLIALMIGGCGGGGGGGSPPPPPPPPPPGNSAPVFTSGTTASFAENATGTVYTATATDADGNAITFSLSGTDQAAFNLTTGVLTFKTPPNFEAPTDNGANNVYDVTIGAFDGTATTNLSLAVTVTNVANGIAVQRVATGLSTPVFLLGKNDGTGRVFVLEKDGVIRILNPTTGAVATTPFLTATNITTQNERGLLGMALSPDFATSRVFYIFVTGANGQIQLRRHTVSAGNGDVADATADIIFTAEHSAASNHNGGWMGFGPDGLLYFMIGDGGADSTTAQNVNSPLGKVLRIDVSRDDFPADANRDYGIPPTNPFAGGGGLAEILHRGLRNPYRASFDRNGNGFLYIGDVGQAAVEEVDLARPSDGALNFGWDIFEGTSQFKPGSSAGITFPIAQYPHGSGPLAGNTVIGGYVYRGPVTPLQGHYVFGDYALQNFWSIPVSSISQGTTIPVASFTNRTAQFAPDVGSIGLFGSFGEDDAGNLYIVELDGDIFKIVDGE